MIKESTAGGEGMFIYTQIIEDEEKKRLFEEIYLSYRGRMLTLARQMLKNHDDAEDAVHQAFLSIAEQFSRLSRLPRVQLEGYLVVVAEHKCIDILRRRAHQRGVPFDEEMTLIAPQESGNAIADAMGRLSPRYREALLLRYGCGYSTRETAQLLHMSHGAVQKLLQRAKAALRAELEREGIEV